MPVGVSQAYAVIADIQRYPDFLSNCETLEVLSRQPLDASEPGGQVRARIVAAAKGVRHQVVTVNQHRPGCSIDIALEDGPFQHLNGRWTFVPIDDLGCRITLELDFVPKGIVVRALTPLIEKAADAMVDAFVARISALTEASN